MSCFLGREYLMSIQLLGTSEIYNKLDHETVCMLDVDLTLKSTLLHFTLLAHSRRLSIISPRAVYNTNHVLASVIVHI